MYTFNKPPQQHVSTMGVGGHDIWRQKKYQRIGDNGQWAATKHELQNTKEDRRLLEIFRRPPQEITPEVKPPKPKGYWLARSEKLWELYISGPHMGVRDVANLDRIYERMPQSSWPKQNLLEVSLYQNNYSIESTTTTTTSSSTMLNENDFWGYDVKDKSSYCDGNCRSQPITWGLCVPTDWHTPFEFYIPINWDLFEKSDDKMKNESCIKCIASSSKPISIKAAESKDELIEEKVLTADDTVEERVVGNKEGESNKITDVNLDCEVSRRSSKDSDHNLAIKYKIENLFFETNTDVRKRRISSQITSPIMYENTSSFFPRSVSSPMLTAVN